LSVAKDPEVMENVRLANHRRSVLLTNTFDNYNADLNQAKALEASRGLKACKDAFAKVFAARGLYLST